MKRFATHCDTEIKWFDTLAEAESEAISQIEVSRREQHDGWNEELTEGIVVMQLVRRAVKVDPNADYRCVDYKLATCDKDDSKAIANWIEGKFREACLKDTKRLQESLVMLNIGIWKGDAPEFVMGVAIASFVKGLFDGHQPITSPVESN